MRNKKTKQIIDHWLDLMQAAASYEQPVEPTQRPMWPERTMIQPANCRDLLGDLFVLEIGLHGAKYRLAGTRLCDLHGRELRAEEFSSAFGGRDANLINNKIEDALQNDSGLLVLSSGMNISGEHVNLETVLLPLMSNGQRGKRMLGLTTPWEKPAWVGSKALVGQRISGIRPIRPWENAQPVLQERRVAARRPFTPASGEYKFNPMVFTPSPSLETEQKAAADPTSYKKAGHLTVIDGGKI